MMNHLLLKIELYHYMKLILEAMLRDNRWA